VSKPRLIVVDDDPEMAALIADVGEMTGFESEVSISAKALLEAETQSRHDVMVIDLFMPDTDGFELINTLAEQGCKAAIIMVSGYDKALLRGAGQIATAHGLNLLGTLAKPFRLEEVEALLRKAIGNTNHG